MGDKEFIPPIKPITQPETPHDNPNSVITIQSKYLVRISSLNNIPNKSKNNYGFVGNKYTLKFYFSSSELKNYIHNLFINNNNPSIATIRILPESIIAGRNTIEIEIDCKSVGVLNLNINSLLISGKTYTFDVFSFNVILSPFDEIQTSAILGSPIQLLKNKGYGSGLTSFFISNPVNGAFSIDKNNCLQCFLTPEQFASFSNFSCTITAYKLKEGNYISTRHIKTFTFTKNNSNKVIKLPDADYIDLKNLFINNGYNGWGSEYISTVEIINQSSNLIDINDIFRLENNNILKFPRNPSSDMICTIKIVREEKNSLVNKDNTYPQWWYDMYGIGGGGGMGGGGMGGGGMGGGGMGGAMPGMGFPINNTTFNNEVTFTFST